MLSIGPQNPLRPQLKPFLTLFEGRYSFHRMSPVEGHVPRYGALIAYDTKPGSDSSDPLKLARRGRSEPVAWRFCAR